MSQDLPIVLEVIESTERIEKILPRLDEMVEGGLITLEEQLRVYVDKGAGRVSPFLVPMMMTNATAGTVAMQLGWTGPNLCISTACAAVLSTASRLRSSVEANPHASFTSTRMPMPSVSALPA